MCFEDEQLLDIASNSWNINKNDRMGLLGTKRLRSMQKSNKKPRAIAGSKLWLYV